MEPRSEPASSVWPFAFAPEDWEHTPTAVQAYVYTLQDELTQLRARVDALEARLRQNSTTSSRPPSSDSPYKKPRRPASSTTPRKAGGKPGHPGHHQVLLPPTTVQELRPKRCACGHTAFALTTPYQTHQVIELPPIEMEVTHWVLHQGCCRGCGTWSKAQLPPEHASGYGPRFSAFIGELAGTYGNGRRMVQTLCASVLQIPLSLGAIQKVLDRVAQAIEPHYLAIATQARHAPVNYKGNRWVERILSLKETCRLRARSTYTVLVEAVTSFFQGHQPDLSWINAEVSTSAHPL
jgi:transposase